MTTSSSPIIVLFFGAIGAASLIYLQFANRNDTNKMNTEDKTSKDNQTDITPVSTPIVSSKQSPKKVLSEEELAQQKMAAEMVSLSYSLTESAANQDPSIAEQNRLIAEQKRHWEQVEAKKAEWESKSKERREKREATQLARENCPEHTEKKRQAESMVLRAYELTEMKALNDPTIMDENNKIMEQKRAIQVS